MKSVIDIGSNSVRLAIIADGRMIFKKKITTQMGRGLALGGKILPEKQAETINAIASFVVKSLSYGVKEEDIHAFATATVRRAENGSEFVKQTLAQTGVKIDVVSEQTEALLALTGCFGDADGAVLDVGGGSSELIVRSGGRIEYQKSLPIGAVVVTDLYKGDKASMREYVRSVVKTYGDVPKIELLTAIGGSSSCVASVLTHSAIERDTDGKVILKTDLDRLSDKFFTLSAEQLIDLGVEKKRTDIIAGGALILDVVLEYLGLDRMVNSESDNLIGYYNLKLRDTDET